MNGNPISFLPQDTINPAIQNLGQTLGAINQQKIGRQEDLQKKFQSLLDVSYEGMLANHQNEVMQDWDKFKSNAINVFKSASEAGTPINQNEYSKVLKEHNDVIRKAEYARQLKQDYYKTMSDAAKLDAANKLDPESKQLLDDWKLGKGTLYDLPVPSSLIRTQYSPLEIGTIEKGLYNDQTLLKKEQVKQANGDIKTLEYYDPDNVAKVAADRIQTDSDFAKFVQRNYGSLQNYVTQKQGIYDKQYQGLKRKPTGSVMNFGYGAPGTEKIPGTQIEGGRQYDVSQKNLNYTGKVTLPDGKQSDVIDAVVSKIVKYDDGTSEKLIMVKVPNPKWIKAGGSLNPLNPEPKTITVEGVAPSEGEAETTLEKSKSFLEKYPDGKAPVKGQKSGSVTKLTGDEDTSTLDPNKVYELDGQKVKWNGKNLVRQK